jgi:hypothetical protein
MKRTVAIFSSREKLETLSSSIEAALVATSQADTTIDVIVNGNHVLAEEAGSYVRSLHAQGRASTLVRAWYIPVADKAHAWNQYLCGIWPESDIGYFIDGCASDTRCAQNDLGRSCSCAKSNRGFRRSNNGPVGKGFARASAERGWCAG